MEVEGGRNPGDLCRRLDRNRLAMSIVTVPLGVLKRGGLRFDPPLPAPVQRAVDALGIRSLREDRAGDSSQPFWRDFELSHLIVFPSAAAEPAMWVFDLAAFGAGPVLCAHLFHTITPHALDCSAAEAVDWLKGVLDRGVRSARCPIRWRPR